jgi:hypothetical protein
MSEWKEEENTTEHNRATQSGEREREHNIERDSTQWREKERRRRRDRAQQRM